MDFKESRFEYGAKTYSRLTARPYLILSRSAIFAVDCVVKEALLSAIFLLSCFFYALEKSAEVEVSRAEEDLWRSS